MKVFLLSKSWQFFLWITGRDTSNRDAQELFQYIDSTISR